VKHRRGREQPGPAPSETAGTSAGDPKHRRRGWRVRALFGIGIIIVLIGGLVGAEAAYLAYRNHQIKRLAVKHLAQVATKGPDVGVQTFLLIGSTSRCALKQQSQAFGTCQEGITGVNADVTMLLRADPAKHTVSILSIPRDLVLENVRDDEQRFYKIDAALAEGPSQLVNVIEQDYGIPINHFVELNFDSFQNVVNALGGVDLDFPYPVYDDYSSLHIATAGCHHLNGFEALAVVRSRHLSYKVGNQWDYDGSGDLGRIIRVHEFLRVLAATLQQRGLGNPFRDNALIGAIAPQLTVDSSLSISDMVRLVLALHDVNVATAPQLTMPNIEDTQDYLWNGIDFGSVVLPSFPQDQLTVDKFEGLSTPPGSVLTPSSISVSVTNGTDIANDQLNYAERLKTLGFHLTGTGTTTPVGPISETVVYYSPGHLLDAERVTQSLAGIVSMAQGHTLDGADVSIVTGSNAFVRLPSTHHTTHHSGTVKSNPYPVLTPVSNAAQALPSYDPRACPAT
jgi:LCP family protein required for cell wall assembly